MLRCTPRIFGTRWFLMVWLLCACIFLPAMSGSAVSAKLGTMAVLRYDTVSRYARTPTPFAALALRARSTPHSTITVTYHGFSASAQAAFQAAVDIWASLISSKVPIRIDATWTALGTGILGQAGPTEVLSNFTGAPISNTWYPKALADTLAGADLDSTKVDITAQFSSAYPSWYLGTDGNTPANMIDFETVVLHECCHGLGFLGSMNMTGSSGSWGYSGFPMIFDRYTVNGSNQLLINTSLFPNPSAALGAQLTSGNVFFNGPQAMAANNGVPPTLYSPSKWQSGSSISHLDENTYPWGVSPNALMTPILSPGISLHYPGPIVLGVLTDIGWTVILPNVATPTFTPDGGTYTTAQNVTISCATPNASIYYTTNGNTPTIFDTLYQSAVPISTTTTLTAKAFMSGVSPSAVKSALYTINSSSLITPSAGSNGSITPNTPQTVPFGGAVNFTAAANAGYTVDTWSLDSVTVQTGGQSYTVKTSGFTGGSTHTVKVTFKALPITISPAAGSNGTITPNTLQTVAIGTPVTFSAAANAGYTVDSWTLDSVTAQTGGTLYTVKTSGFTGGSTHTVKVTFKALPITISPAAGSNGTITPNTLQTVAIGTPVTFTAAANAGYTVDSWTLDSVSMQIGGKSYTVNTSGFTGGSAHTIKVTFKALFTVTPTAGLNGSITPSTPQTIIAGSSLTFTAKPNVGYRVADWAVDQLSVHSTALTYTLSNISASHTIEATFTPLIFTITPTAGANGTISPKTPQLVNYGGSTAFTAVANAGYTVNIWSLDGSTVQVGGASYRLANIIAAHTVQVSFSLLPIYQPDLAVANYGETAYTGVGIINTTGALQTKSQTITAGSTATYLLHVQNTGNTVDIFTLGCSAVSSAWTMQVIEQSTGRDVSTAFTGMSYTTVSMASSAIATYIIHVTPARTQPPGTTLTLTFTATSTANRLRQDVVKMATTASVLYQPDLSIRNPSDNYIGGSIFNLNGAGQTATQLLPPGATSCFLFRVQNAGNTVDQYLLSGTAGISGWTVAYYDMNSASNLTTLFTGAGASTGSLAPGASKGYFVQITPAINAPPYTSCTVQITAASAAHITQKDVIKATTTASGLASLRVGN